MSSYPYYKSAHWRGSRARRLTLDEHMCVVPGCCQRAATVDHIKRRRDGDADTIETVPNGVSSNQAKWR
jgi:hypothetical protein